MKITHSIRLAAALVAGALCCAGAAMAQTPLSLVSDRACYKQGDTVTVSVNMGASAAQVWGGQFWLTYDTSKLAFVSASAGDAPFTMVVYQNFAGNPALDLAVGVPFGGTGTTAAHTMARFTFTAIADTTTCSQGDLVSFRPHSPPTMLTDGTPAPVPTVLSNLNAIDIDTVAPVITCPPNISVNADAGQCAVTLNYTNHFDTAPALSNTQGPGVFYVDRYPPAGFAKATFLGDNRLKESISSADSFPNRPPAYQSNFYNTQGRAYDVNLPVGQKMGIDLYVDPTWLAGNLRRADLWAVGVDAQGVIEDYAIIGFSSSNPSGDGVAPGSENPDPLQAGGVPRFRVYIADPGTWVTVGGPPTAGWHRLEVRLNATTKDYILDGVTVYSMTNYGSVRLSSALIQAYNFGTSSTAGPSYDVYWDNLTVGPQGPVATDNCNVAVTYTRSDNPMLTLFDPFPAGDTTVTWTATDCSGNTTSCPQTVHVTPVIDVDVTVQLAGVTSGTFTRAITFDIYDSAPSCAIVQTVCRTMTFVNGMASDSFQVACGPHTSITARDRLHTLRRTQDPIGVNMMVSPNRYTASFTGPRALLGGNLNADKFVDILDFGVFVGQWGQSPSPSTTCAQVPPFRHADINGDGVVSVVDYTFISAQFLQQNDPDACGATFDGDQPVVDISVRELVAMGEYEMARTADLNLDGRLNVADMQFAAMHQPPYCTADFNHSGAANVQDIFDYLSAWFNQHPAADIDDNHRVDVPDLFNFLGAWFTSCP